MEEGDFKTGATFVLPGVCWWPDRICTVVGVRDRRVRFSYEVELLHGGRVPKYLEWEAAYLLVRGARLAS